MNQKKFDRHEVEILFFLTDLQMNRKTAFFILILWFVARQDKSSLPRMLHVCEELHAISFGVCIQNVI